MLTFIVCTPLGFARLFTVLGQYVVKPQVRNDHSYISMPRLYYLSFDIYKERSLSQGWFLNGLLLQIASLQVPRRNVELAGGGGQTLVLKIYHGTT